MSDKDGDGFLETPRAACPLPLKSSYPMADRLGQHGAARYRRPCRSGHQCLDGHPESPAWTDALISGKLEAAQLPLPPASARTSSSTFLAAFAKRRAEPLRLLASLPIPELDAALDAVNATTDAAEPGS